MLQTCCLKYNLPVRSQSIMEKDIMFQVLLARSAQYQSLCSRRNDRQATDVFPQLVVDLRTCEGVSKSYAVSMWAVKLRDEVDEKLVCPLNPWSTQ